MFNRIKQAVTSITNAIASTLSSPAGWLLDAVSFGRSDSGIKVNDQSALSSPPVWYAVSRIAGNVAQLPLIVHRRLDRGAERDRQHPAYRLMKTRPNRYQTAYQFKETLMVHALLWGNGRAAIVRRNGIPVELLVIPPSRCVTCYLDGEKYHVVDLDPDDRLFHTRLESGALSGNRYLIQDRDVLQIPGLGLDGIGGLQVFDLGKNAIGLGLAAEKASNKHFKNSGVPDLIIEAPAGVFRNEQDAAEFMKGWEKFHKGLDNRSRTGLLREGMKASKLSMTAGESQWIEQRKFQRQEVALIFMLESILGDDESVSYNSAEQKTLAYLVHCLNRWLIKMEQECDEKLLRRRETLGDTHFWKFSTAALLKSDFKSTIESLGLAITHRIMSPNEAREKLDMNPYDGGDEYFNPAITPGGGSDEKEESESQSTPDDAGRQAVVAHLKHMIRVEAKQVLAAAGNKRNYIGWVDSFYDGKWNSTMQRAVEQFGCDPSAANKYCEDSRKQLIEVCGSVTPDGLADAVDELVNSWPDRAERLADLVLSGELIDA